MGSSYNVRVPFGTMGQSVGRQIEEKKSRGFVANMQRLNEALAPHALKAQEHRAQMELEEERFSNKVEMLDHTLDAEIRKYDTLRQREIEEDAVTSAALEKYKADNADNPDAMTDYAALMGAVPGLDRDDILNMKSLSSSLLDQKKFSREVAESEARIKRYNLEAESARQSLIAKQQGWAAWSPREQAEAERNIAELEQFDKTSKMIPEYNRMIAEAATAESKAKVNHIVAQNAKKTAQYQGRLDKINMETAEYKNALAKSGLEGQIISNISKRQDVAVGNARTRIEAWDEQIDASVVDLAKAKDPTVRRTQEKIIRKTLNVRNAIAKGLGAPLLMLDAEGAVGIDYEATQAMHQEEEAIKAIAAQTDSPELLVQALLKELDLDSVDTAFLVKVPTILAAVGKQPDFIQRVTKTYLTQSDDILSQRRAEAAANRPKNVPTTEGDITSGVEEEEKSKKKQAWYSGIGQWSLPGIAAKPFSKAIRHLDETYGAGNIVRNLGEKMVEY